MHRWDLVVRMREAEARGAATAVRTDSENLCALRLSVQNQFESKTTGGGLE